MKQPMRYWQHELLAIEPRALFGMFAEKEQPPNRTVDGATVVTIRGPLEHHAGGWFDSYESILERVDAACAASTPSIVLCVDSPGGELAGALEAARAIRERAAAANKTLATFVEGDACSAGYALACAGSQIVVAPTATLGSIGILAPRIDVTAQDEALGMRFDFITSGARKTDGNPHTSMSEDERTAHQARVADCAELFFQLVADMRGLSVEEVAGFQAGVLIGASAVDEGLADRVDTLNGLIAALVEGGPVMAEEETKDDDKEARAALGRIAEGDSEQAKRARLALKALDSGPGDDDEEDEDDEEADEKDKPKKEDAAVAASASSSTSADLAQLVQTYGARIISLEKERDDSRLSALFAGRPDLSKDLVAVLRTKAYAEAKQIVDSIPRPTLASNPAATAVVAATRGRGQDDPGRPVGTPGCEALDEAFGLAAPKPAIRREGTKAIFGTHTSIKTTASSTPNGGQ